MSFSFFVHGRPVELGFRNRLSLTAGGNMDDEEKLSMSLNVIESCCKHALTINVLDSHFHGKKKTKLAMLTIETVKMCFPLLRPTVKPTSKKCWKVHLVKVPVGVALSLHLAYTVPDRRAADPHIQHIPFFSLCAKLKIIM